MMVKAIEKAIRAGGIRDMSYEDKIMVSRALCLLAKLPDEPKFVNRYTRPIKER